MRCPLRGAAHAHRSALAAPARGRLRLHPPAAVRPVPFGGARPIATQRGSRLAALSDQFLSAALVRSPRNWFTTRGSVRPVPFGGAVPIATQRGSRLAALSDQFLSAALVRSPRTLARPRDVPAGREQTSSAASTRSCFPAAGETRTVRAMGREIGPPDLHRTTADPTPPLRNRPSGTRQGAAGPINRFGGV